jgi:hypothetical protein
MARNPSSNKRTKMTTRANPKRADLEALVCMDNAHQWRQVEDEIATRGPWAGCPRRVKLCMVCGGMKAETINWRGNVINRSYYSAEDYINNARLLSDDVHERRIVLRRMLIENKHGKQRGICKVCFLPLKTADHEECK